MSMYCQDCGKRLSFRAAERASAGDGCPDCGADSFDVTAPHPVNTPLPEFNQWAIEMQDCGYDLDGES